MNKQLHLLYYIAPLLAVLLLGAACSQRQQPAGQREESREAKRLLQGVWSDEETETPVFQVKGDTIYYADPTSMPAYLKVVDDTLYIGSTTRYCIVKQSEHVLWFRTQGGETMKYQKSTAEDMSPAFDKAKPQILTLTEVLKRDTVVFYEGQRYHLYVAVNPTRYKVAHRTVNDDGLEVENVYYDNIIHLSIFQGARQLFSRDFRKQLYQQVPARFLSEAVLNNMEYDHTDSRGFHLNASLCVPDDASCYLVEHIVSFDGKLTTQTIEY